MARFDFQTDKEMTQQQKTPIAGFTFSCYNYFMFRGQRQMLK